MVNYPSGVRKPSASATKAATPKPAVQPRGRHVPGVMNKLEAAWAKVLDERKLAGEVEWWAFESVKLKLGPLSTYTPDFLVMLSDGLIVIEETKGFMREDAAVKLRVCQGMYPFPIRLIKQVKGEWEIKEYS